MPAPMSAPLGDPPPAAPTTPTDDLLTRIADETELDDPVRVPGQLLAVPVRCRLVTEALADALQARYFGGTTTGGPPPGARGGGRTFVQVAAALRPRFLGRDGWTLRYRIEAGVPVFLVATTGGPGHPAASCFLDLAPGVAPEFFARLVTTLDGYGLGLRAELRGSPAAPERMTAAVVTVSRTHAATLARVALRMRARCPLLFGRSVPPLTRPLAPGIGLADEPRDGTGFARSRCRLIAAALVAAGPGAGAGRRRVAVLEALADAGLDPAAPHLNPGSPEFPV